MSAVPAGKGKANSGGNPRGKTSKEPPPPEISLKQSKNMRKAQNAEAESRRLQDRERMEKMSLSDDESASNLLIKNAIKIESQLGSGKGFIDAFGNTTAASSDKTKESSKILERQRAEAKVRREAKFKAEADEADLKQAAKSCNSDKISKTVVSLTRQEELEAIQLRAANNEILSNRDLKFLRKHEQEVSLEAAMAKEYATGLSNYSLSIGGKGIQTASDDESEINISKTLSARDIIVPNFSISAPHRVLFQDACLRLVSGRRYGLLAPNGRGKSTLLKFIAARRLPIPPTISILMLDQEILASSDSVVHQVLSADTRRCKLFEEQSNLFKLLDSDIDHDQSEGFATAESLTAGNPSTSQACTKLSDTELANTVERLRAIGDEMDSIGAYNSEAKVCRILTGLGFTINMQNANSMHLSGGWRVRLSLARALFMEPILLLLDEPTNHLDLDAVLWLDEYLSTQWKGTALIVSHDSDFLDSVCTDIMNVDETKINYYSGNVTNFEKMKNQIAAKKVKDYKLQKKTVKDFEGKGMNLEKAIKRTQEKLEISTLLSEEPRQYRVNFSFKFAEDTFPSISVLDAGFRYSPDTPPLFSEMRFGLGTSSKIAIVGPNGSGKSTLLRLLTGRLEPTHGVISLHQHLRIGIYDQHFEDLLPHHMTPIAYLCSQFEGVNILEARKYLGMFGLDGARHLINISELSGGQKSRVVFASLALKKPHILILDEPTNHLDLESVDALTRALKEFKGGVILVSHDARLITATECEIWVCEGGLEGGDGIYGTGLRVERRGFQYYRIDVIRQIAKRIDKAEKVVLAKAMKRKEDKEQKVLLAAAAIQKKRGKA